MAKKNQSPSSAELEKLENARRKLDRKISKKRSEENDRRGIAGYRDMVNDYTKEHNDRVERQTGYDTTDKARTFGFGAFDGAIDGALVFARVDAIYAVEKDPNEKFTMLKTVDGPLAVTQAPDEVFNELTKVRFSGSAEQVREMQGELFRREDKVAAAKNKAKAKADKKLGTPGSTGPDFQAVSDLVGTDLDDDDLDPNDAELPDPQDDDLDDQQDETRPDGGIH